MAVVPPNANAKLLGQAVRKTVLISLTVSMVGFIISIFVDYAFVGVGLFAGTFIGALNLRLMDSKVANAKYEGSKMAKKGIVFHSIGRLIGATGIIVGSALINIFLAIGILVGLVVFQAVLLLTMVKSLNSSRVF
jgi:hypothetical protein